MADKKIVTLPRPDQQAIAVGAPILLPAVAKVSQCELSEQDRKRVTQIIQHLMADSDIPQKYCSGCKAEETKTGSTVANYIPVIILPSSSAKTQIDIGAEMEKFYKAQMKPSVTNKTATAMKEDQAPKEPKKKRAITLQRLTDFDLLSQW